MTQFEIISESETPGGWTYDVRIFDAGGRLRTMALTLSWADYNLWSANGADEPQAVASAAIAFLLARTPAAGLRSRIDASILRRLHPGADETIPRLIRPAAR